MARKRLHEEPARAVNVLLPVKKKTKQLRAAKTDGPLARPPPQQPKRPRLPALDASYSQRQLLVRLGDADVDSEELDEAVGLVEDARAGDNYVYTGGEILAPRAGRTTRSASARRVAAIDADEFEAADVEEEEGEDEEDADEEDADEEDADEAAAPVVFQCGTCRSIVGDSYAFVGANADLLLVTLSDATNVARSLEPQTAGEGGADTGASFRELLCTQCQAVLGRQYEATPVALDAIRGLFSFSTAAIASYQLGYPQLERRGAAVGAEAAAKQAAAAFDATARSFAADREELWRLRKDMAKVQKLLLVVDERLRSLENEQQPDSEADDAPAVAANR